MIDMLWTMFSDHHTGHLSTTWSSIRRCPIDVFRELKHLKGKIQSSEVLKILNWKHPSNREIQTVPEQMNRLRTRKPFHLFHAVLLLLSWVSWEKRFLQLFKSLRKKGKEFWENISEQFQLNGVTQRESERERQQQKFSFFRIFSGLFSAVLRKVNLTDCLVTFFLLPLNSSTTWEVESELFFRVLYVLPRECPKRMTFPAFLLFESLFPRILKVVESFMINGWNSHANISFSPRTIKSSGEKNCSTTNLA